MTQTNKPEEYGTAPVAAGAAGHAQADDINVSMVAVVGAFAAVLLFVLIVLLQAWFYSWNEAEQQRKTEPSVALQQNLSEQQGKLNGYRKVSVGTGPAVWAIPIDRAMELEAAALRAQQGGREVTKMSAGEGGAWPGKEVLDEK